MSESHLPKVPFSYDVEIPPPSKRGRAYDADFVDQLLNNIKIDLTTLNEYAEKINYLESALAAAQQKLSKQEPSAAIAEQATELLKHAARVADEHVKIAEDKAQTLVHEAERRLHESSLRAQEAKTTLQEDIKVLSDARTGIVNDLQGLLQSHLSALKKFAEKTINDPAPEPVVNEEVFADEFSAVPEPLFEETSPLPVHEPSPSLEEFAINVAKTILSNNPEEAMHVDDYIEYMSAAAITNRDLALAVLSKIGYTLESNEIRPVQQQPDVDEEDNLLQGL